MTTLAWRDSLALNLRAMSARAYVRVVGSLREPDWFISDADFPESGHVRVRPALSRTRRAASATRRWR